MVGTDVSDQVRAQYEALPYPMRNPEDERTRLLVNFGDDLVRVNHFCFGGRLDVSKGFRCLIAGGGTGDATIYLAEQLRDFPSEIVYLDMSEASLAVARARAEVRGLTNVQWRTGSLLDLPDMGLDPFDYISCTGVLHHLASPEDGLRSLASVLKPDGSMLLMLYGKYGRRPVYDMQELLRKFIPPDASVDQKIAVARTILGSLPASNWFQRDMDNWRDEISPAGNGDAGLYDLLLHSQDQAYDVPGIHRIAESAGLVLQGFPYRADRYDPYFLTQDESLDTRLEQLAAPERQAISELLRCDISRHVFYVGRDFDTCARLDDADMAPLLYGELSEKREALSQDLAGGGVVKLTINDVSVGLQGSAVLAELVRRLDGAHTVKDLVVAVRQVLPEAAEADIHAQLAGLYEILSELGLCYLIKCGGLGTAVPSIVRQTGGDSLTMD